jgi:polysaccharide export outer membrane protein
MRITAAVLALVALTGVVSAQQSTPPKPGSTTPASKPGPKMDPLPPTTLPADYLIGANDILTIKTDVVFKGSEVSSDVMVRPDGKISLLMIDDVQAAGLTPDQLKQALVKAVTPLKA